MDNQGFEKGAFMGCMNWITVVVLIIIGIVVIAINPSPVLIFAIFIVAIIVGVKVLEHHTIQNNRRRAEEAERLKAEQEEENI